VNIYAIYLTGQAESDLERMKRSGNQFLERKLAELIQVLKEEPERQPPPVKRLNGDLSGLWARRLNAEHRLIYRIDFKEKAVIIVGLWTRE
jgi:toxin YoeB